MREHYKIVRHWIILLGEKALQSITTISFFQVFLKETLGYHLDELRNAVVIKAVLRIQCLTRTFLQQRRYHRIRRASVVLQAGLRRWIAR